MISTAQRELRPPEEPQFVTAGSINAVTPLPVIRFFVSVLTAVSTNRRDKHFQLLVRLGSDNTPVSHGECRYTGDAQFA